MCWKVNSPYCCRDQFVTVPYLWFLNIELSKNVWFSIISKLSLNMSCWKFTKSRNIKLQWNHPDSCMPWILCVKIQTRWKYFPTWTHYTKRVSPSCWETEIMVCIDECSITFCGILFCGLLVLQLNMNTPNRKTLLLVCVTPYLYPNFMHI
jgi:hypothetical protein